MAEGITLRFQRDELGRPLVMYIRDLLGVCPICGQELIERTYDQVSYHGLTAGRFRQLVVEAPSRYRQVCEQCGEALGPEQVERWTVTYGYPLERGLIQGMARRLQGRVATDYVLSPHRAFDPQMHPDWEPEDDQSVERVEELTEEEIRSVTGRYLSLKAGWRRLLKRVFEPGGPDRAVVELAPDTYGLVARSAALLRDERRALVEQSGGSGEGDWVWSLLADEINELLACGPNEWLPEAWYSRLESREVWAMTGADVRPAEGILREALAALPGPTGCDVDPSLEATVTFPMGDEPAVAASISLKQVVLEGVVCGAAPADWIRLWLDDTIARIAIPEADD